RLLDGAQNGHPPMSVLTVIVLWVPSFVGPPGQVRIVHKRRIERAFSCIYSRRIDDRLKGRPGLPLALDDHVKLVALVVQPADHGPNFACLGVHTDERTLIGLRALLDPLEGLLSSSLYLGVDSRLDRQTAID